jgi:hypothetical protein
MPKLDGKITRVTSGPSGIGVAAATALAKEGAYVYITGSSRTGTRDCWGLRRHLPPMSIQPKPGSWRRHRAAEHQVVRGKVRTAGMEASSFLALRCDRRPDDSSAGRRIHGEQNGRRSAEGRFQSRSDGFTLQRGSGSHYGRRRRSGGLDEVHSRFCLTGKYEVRLAKWAGPQEGDEIWKQL